MPRRIESERETLVFTFEGEQVEALVGETVAAALAAAGIRHLRDSTVSGEPRGIFCMMGACFDCLVEVGGMPNRQACMTEVREGLVVNRQSGAAEVVL